MTLVGFKAANHPQQVQRSGADDDVDDRMTDPALFAQLDARFGFTLDAAASAQNAQCPRFFDRQADGLAQPWAGERVYCNPPYSAIAPWVAKAWDEHPAAPLVVMLLPANRTEQAFWMDLVEPYRDRPGSPLTVEFLRGRLRFLRNGAQSIKANERPPFGCCLAIWGDVPREPAPPFSRPQRTLWEAS